MRTKHLKSPYHKGWNQTEIPAKAIKFCPGTLIRKLYFLSTHMEIKSTKTFIIHLSKDKQRAQSQVLLEQESDNTSTFLRQLALDKNNLYLQLWINTINHSAHYPELHEHMKWSKPDKTASMASNCFPRKPECPKCHLKSFAKSSFLINCLSGPHKFCNGNGDFFIFLLNKPAKLHTIKIT